MASLTETAYITRRTINWAGHSFAASYPDVTTGWVVSGNYFAWTDGMSLQVGFANSTTYYPNVHGMFTGNLFHTDTANAGPLVTFTDFGKRCAARTAPVPPVIEMAVLGDVKFDPESDDRDVEPADVSRPCVSTVNNGIAEDDPYDPAVTPVVARSIVAAAFSDPDPVTIKAPLAGARVAT
jgi:hypothetical protein